LGQVSRGGLQLRLDVVVSILYIQIA